MTMNETEKSNGADKNTQAADAARRGTRTARRIALLTAGGDAPGMNAGIRAVVRTAVGAGLEVLGAQRGFEGLIYGNFEPLPNRSVSNILQHGGTILETSRTPEFGTEAGRTRSAENLRYRGVRGLIVMGGDGSLAAARAFANDTAMRVMFIPATIDNDVPNTDFSIGFETAVNTALQAIDRIRDTAFANDRLFFVEVMGRDSGFIALSVAIGGGAEVVIVPEIPFDLEDMCRRIEESQLRGKRSSIIVVSEGPRTGGAISIANSITERLGMQSRVVVLGHIQRGGAPTARDRLLASRMGAAAVQALINDKPSSLIGEVGGRIVEVPFEEVAKGPQPFDSELIDLVHLLSI
jgi:6-phosphofructokinase 1